MRVITQSDASELARLEGIVRRGKKVFLEVGNALKEIRDKRLYRATHRAFGAYVEERFGFTRQRAHQFIDAADVEPEVSTIVDRTDHSIDTESQLREVAKVPPSERKEVIERALDLADERGTTPTAAIIAEARTNSPAAKYNTGDFEWYTPPEFIEAAKSVMGGITLDPASSHEANKVVDAETFFTQDDDGLSRNWFGNVWLNPPYSRDLISRFARKLTDEWLASERRITSAIALTNAQVDAKWWQDLAEQATCICLVRGRIRFDNPNRDANNAPTMGQSVFYFGANGTKFCNAFKSFGCVSTPDKSPTTDATGWSGLIEKVQEFERSYDVNIDELAAVIIAMDGRTRAALMNRINRDEKVRISSGFAMPTLEVSR